MTLSCLESRRFSDAAFGLTAVEASKTFLVGTTLGQGAGLVFLPAPSFVTSGDADPGKGGAFTLPLAPALRGAAD